MTENKSQGERAKTNLKLDIGEEFLVQKQHSNKDFLNVKIEDRSESAEDKKPDEILESNSDSNKSQNMFQTPTNMHSSNCSVNKDIDYMTPKSRHNLNLLFTESNGKKSQTQRRIINHVK
jgi:hypothetical protein